MGKQSTLRWFLASVCLLFFTLPVILADELPLLANWLLVFVCWLLLIVICAYQALNKKEQ